MNRYFKRLLAVFILAGLLIGAVFFLSPDARKSAQLKAVDKIGDIAAKRISENPDAEGSVAAEFINIPIEAREIAPGIFQATGVGNAHLITTQAGDVLFDTGLATQVPKQMDALKQAHAGIDLTHIIVSHSHADHSGGVKFWQEDGIEIVAHQEFAEEQRYLKETEPYQWQRNRMLFPFMPENPPNIGLIAFGGVEPTIAVPNGQPFQFSQGGVDFEVLALPGAEGADNLVLWLPEQKILFSGDFFGPLFPQFPNIFTMRGEKIRKPIEYINSLNVIIELDPDMIVPSHKDPVTDKMVIREGLIKMRDATQYVHDAVIAGMNSGRSVEELMASIELPPELALTQEHGRVSWAVKSIWEYYMTWFHFDKTTELYAVPFDAVYADIANLAGNENLVRMAEAHVSSGKPLHGLHLLNIALGAEPDNKEALTVKKQALQDLLAQAKAAHNNSYEIYWLNAQIRQIGEKL